MRDDYLEAAASWGYPRELALAEWNADYAARQLRAKPIPEGSMRVGPGTDAVVWRVCPDWNVEL